MGRAEKLLRLNDGGYSEEFHCALCCTAYSLQAEKYSLQFIRARNLSILKLAVSGQGKLRRDESVVAGPNTAPHCTISAPTGADTFVTPAPAPSLIKNIVIAVLPRGVDTVALHVSGSRVMSSKRL